MAVYRPCWGGTPDAMASAIDSGSATSPTTRPAITSARNAATSYWVRITARSAAAGRPARMGAASRGSIPGVSGTARIQSR